MATKCICDYCGEPIEEDDRMVKIQAFGSGLTRGNIGSEIIGEYHGDPPPDGGDSCYLQLLAAVRAAEREGNIRQQEYRRREHVWRGMSSDERTTLVLQALGDDRLTIRELARRMNAELGFSDEDRPIYDTYVAALVKRLVRRGVLDREPETFMVNHTRFRYFRSGRLAGPIVGLERAFYDDSEAVA